MAQFIHEAGWGIWPVIVFGCLALLTALIHFFSRRSWLPAVVGFSAMTVVAGVLGTAVGVQHSARVVRDMPGLFAFFVGLRESLNCLVMSLFVVGFVTVITTVVEILQRRLLSASIPEDEREPLAVSE